MINRQIVFTKPYTAELLETELPDKPGENEVLVKTVYTAVSAGTERANIVGESNISGHRDACGTAFPRKLGYCGVGKVVAVGSRVKSVTAGQRVVVYFGKHSEYELINEANVIPVKPETLTDEEVALLVIGGFSAEGVRKSRLEFGESAMVVGLGILGVFAVMFCRAAGAVPVIATDTSPAARERGLKFGADYALDPNDPDFFDKVKQYTGGRGNNVTVEATGNPAALRQALRCCAPLGRVTLLGCTRTPEIYDLYHDVHFPGVSLIGAHNFARPGSDSYPGNWTAADDIRAMMKMTALGRINPASLVSEIHSPNEAQAVYDRLVNDRSFPAGVLFDWRKL